MAETEDIEQIKARIRLEEEARAAVWREKSKKAYNRLFSWAFYLAIGFIVLLTLAHMVSPVTMADRHEIRARHYIERVVKNQLVSPASARITYYEYSGKDNGTVIALGHVDSQNRLGGTVRSDFEVKVSPCGKMDEWRDFVQVTADIRYCHSHLIVAPR